METVKFRDMLHLQRKKAKNMKNRFYIFCLLMAFAFPCFAQEEIYREEQDIKPYYFGISLSGVYSRFQIEHHPSFLETDTVLVAEPGNTPGISLRLVAALNLSNRFELRFNPVRDRHRKGEAHALRDG